jgi:hypothetical protein
MRHKSLKGGSDLAINARDLPLVAQAGSLWKELEAPHSSYLYFPEVLTEQVRKHYEVTHETKSKWRSCNHAWNQLYMLRTEKVRTRLALCSEMSFLHQIAPYGRSLTRARWISLYSFGLTYQVNHGCGVSRTQQGLASACKVSQRSFFDHEYYRALPFELEMYAWLLAPCQE